MNEFIRFKEEVHYDWVIMGDDGVKYAYKKAGEGPVFVNFEKAVLQAIKTMNDLYGEKEAADTLHRNLQYGIHILNNQLAERFTVEELRQYVVSQDSLGDVLYNLSADKIRVANQPEVEDEE